MKQLNRKTEKEKARKAFKRFIRLRDAKGRGYIACYTCGAVHFFVETHAGHFCQGSHDSVYFDERNCHGQCVKCNLFLHGNLTQYTLRMIDEYGEEVVKELLERNKQTVHMKAPDFHEIYLKYKAECDILEDLWVWPGCMS